MEHTPKIFLVGPMGAGKTTIGRLLAKQLNLPFIDSDKEIEARTGTSIPVIFEYEGEEGFRAREIQAIDELTQKEGVVLATGGGAILKPENRQALASRGTVIYLLTTVDQQLKRTARDKNRPLLQTENPRAKLEELFAIRDPLYREVADIIVKTDSQPPRIVINKILAALQENRVL